MSDLSTSVPELVLTNPVPERDAPFALNWFEGESGRDTLTKMGNPSDQITEPSLEGELATLEQFLLLESEGKQKTWMLRVGEITIGAAWIDLVKNHGVDAPSVHIMIGNPSFRGKGIGRAAMSTMITYLRESGEDTIYSRHLVSNEEVTSLNRSIGFVSNGQSYVDEDGLEWQDIMLSLES